jgi:ribosomal protein L7/L12
MARPTSTTQAQPLTHDQIAVRAYEIWLARGGGDGHHAEDWFEAERDLARPRTQFRVVLASTGENKIIVIKELRAIMGGGIEAAKVLAEQTPGTVKACATRDEAERIRQQLTAAGATVEVAEEPLADVGLASPPTILLGAGGGR